MKTTINIIFNAKEFDIKDVKPLEGIIEKNIPVFNRIKGTVIIWKKITWVISETVYDFDNDVKYLIVKQITNRSILKNN